MIYRPDDYPAVYRYRFCPLCGKDLTLQTDGDRERLRCEHDGWKWYPGPAIASTVVVEHAGGIVLLRRAIPPDVGIWHLPIGHVEYGERPDQAASREVLEETGLILGELTFLDIEFGQSRSDPKLLYHVYCYTAVTIGGEIRLNDENDGIEVVSLDAIPPMKWPSQQRALAAWDARRAGRAWQPAQPLPR